MHQPSSSLSHAPQTILSPNTHTFPLILNLFILLSSFTIYFKYIVPWIIAIGINDAIYLNREKCILTDSETFTKNIQKIIDICKEYTNNILFVGLTKVNEDFTNPISWDNNQSYFNENIKNYNEKIKEICIENNVEFLDIFNLLDEENINIDGIHPNERGHEIIFNNIKRKI